METKVYIFTLYDTYKQNFRESESDKIFTTPDLCHFPLSFLLFLFFTH